MIGGGGRFRRGARARQCPQAVDHLGGVQGENRVTDEPAHIAEYCGKNRSLLMERWQGAHDPIELPREDVKQST
jgi:hypothetical protein